MLRTTMLTAVMLLPFSAFGQFSNPVRDVENPARTAWSGGCTVTWPSGEASTKTCHASVPLNKTFVLETVSVACLAVEAAGFFNDLKVGVGSNPIGFTDAYHHIGLDKQVTGSLISEFRAYLSRLFLVLPATPSSPSVGFTAYKATNTAQGNCSFRASGYTLP